MLAFVAVFVIVIAVKLCNYFIIFLTHAIIIPYFLYKSY